MNRKDLQALNLVGLPRVNLEIDPLALLHLDNRLYICKQSESTHMKLIQTWYDFTWMTRLFKVSPQILELKAGIILLKLWSLFWIFFSL